MTKPRQLPEKQCDNNKNDMLMRLPDTVRSLKIKLLLLDQLLHHRVHNIFISLLFADNCEGHKCVSTGT